ncbi:MAG: sugar transferase [Rhodobacteraceae bacterium]|nr:sugar transferase [Paracoccaceae bacterium]
MFDFENTAQRVALHNQIFLTKNAQQTHIFKFFKRGFDILFCLALLPLAVVLGLALLIVNPFLNQGKLIFAQIRMGRNCKPFVAYKFRSMRDVSKITRGAHDPLELDRITKFGSFLRKTRIDELPQLINVLRGDMSLIGPRPDYFPHARQYLRHIPGYRARHVIRPGISGLAQTEVGYAEGVSAVVSKVKADIYYINHVGFALETWIFWRTLTTVLGRKGH